MTLLNESIQKQIRQVFEALESPVKLMMFTQGGEGEVGVPGLAGVPGIECSMCADTRQLVEEVSALSNKIEVEIYDFMQDAALAKQYHVDKIPAIAITGGPENRDYGIRLYGIPSGYEFGTLIEDILMVSQGKADLSDQTLNEIARLKEPVHIQVYTTPT